MSVDLWIVAGYVVVLVALSLRGGKQVSSAADFTASGGKYGTFVIFATLSASYVGGGYSSGNAAEAFAKGLGTTVALLGFSLSMILIGKFVVPGVARFEGEATTGGIMRRCYGRGAQIITGVFAFLCCAGVVGAQMETMGVVFHTLLGISPTLGILLGGGVVLLYSTFGGMQSVIVADILQFVLLALGMPLLLIGALREIGGVGALLDAVPSEKLNPLHDTTVPAFLSLCGTMALGEALAPPYTQRLLIGKNPAVTARATVMSGVFSIPFFIITGLIGLAAYVLGVTDVPADAMPALIGAVLPVGVRGVVMAAMVSIMLSASDSFLNSAAVSLVCDTLTPLCGLSDPARIKALRLSNLLTGLLAIAAAFMLPDVFSILKLAYSFWCPLILVPLVAAFLGIESDKRVFRYGFVTGLAATLAWEFVLRCPFGIGGDMVGLLGHFAVFAVMTRRYRCCRRVRLRTH